MRNLKKILALVLTVVMSLSLVTIASAKTSFTDDESISPVFEEAVTVLSNLKVLTGYTNGSFQPKDTITRAETAAVIYRALTGDVDNRQVGIYASRNTFSDAKTHWAAGYIGYCANGEYIKGYTDGSFKPEKDVTGYEALAMVLRAVGYGKNGEFEGSRWDLNTATKAAELNITKNITAGTLGQPATREMVADIVFQAINVPTATWTLLGGYQTTQDALGYGAANPTLGEQAFGLTQLSGEITAVGRTAGNMRLQAYTDPASSARNLGAASNDGLNRTTGNYTVAGVDVSWEKIGYAASVWAVADPNTYDLNNYQAVSPVAITGVSMGDNAGYGTSYESLTDVYNPALAGVDYIGPVSPATANTGRVTTSATGGTTAMTSNVGDAFRVYFNGDLLPQYHGEGASVNEPSFYSSTKKSTALGGDFAAGAANFTGYYYDYDLDEICYRYIKEYETGTPKTVKTFCVDIVDMVPGVKVELIDNDNGGQAEAIRVTEYTVATLDGVTNDYNTGLNAIVEASHYFTAYNTARHSAVKPDVSANQTSVKSTYVRYATKKVVTNDTLAVGDLVTYVDYSGDAYVTKAPFTTGVYSGISYYGYLNNDNYYIIGGQNYYVANPMEDAAAPAYAQGYFQGDMALLTATGTENVRVPGSGYGKNLTVWTDPYGLILKVSQYAPANEYLFILATGHSDNIGLTTRALAAFPDGSVKEITVAYGAQNRFSEDIGSHIYRYTINEAGNYVLVDEHSYELGDTDDAVDSVCWAYKKGTGAIVSPDTANTDFGVDMTMTSISAPVTTLTDSKAIISGTDKTVFANESTVFVDVRGSAISRTATVYNNRNLPSMSGDVKLHIVYKALGAYKMATLVFITSGTDTATYKRNFVAYTTLLADGEYAIPNPVIGVNGLYTLPVIADGQLTTTTLTYSQYRQVIDTGVGVYSFGADGQLSEYTAFPEKWEKITWSNGTIILDNNGSPKGYTYGVDDVHFFTLDIANFTAYPYTPNYGYDMDYRTNATMAYVVRNNNDVVTDIYVIYGTKTADPVTDRTSDGVDDLTYAKKATYQKVVGDKVYTYWMQHGMVTNFVATDAPKIRVGYTLDGGDKDSLLTPLYKLAGFYGDITIQVPVGNNEVLGVFFANSNEGTFGTTTSGNAGVTVKSYDATSVTISIAESAKLTASGMDLIVTMAAPTTINAAELQDGSSATLTDDAAQAAKGTIGDNSATVAIDTGRGAAGYGQDASAGKTTVYLKEGSGKMVKYVGGTLHTELGLEGDVYFVVLKITAPTAGSGVPGASRDVYATFKDINDVWTCKQVDSDGLVIAVPVTPGTAGNTSKTPLKVYWGDANTSTNGPDATCTAFTTIIVDWTDGLKPADS